MHMHHSALLICSHKALLVWLRMKRILCQSCSQHLWIMEEWTLQELMGPHCTSVSKAIHSYFHNMNSTIMCPMDMNGHHLVATFSTQIRAARHLACRTYKAVVTAFRIAYLCTWPPLGSRELGTNLCTYISHMAWSNVPWIWLVVIPQSPVITAHSAYA